jgi:hypothetical protein
MYLYLPISVVGYRDMTEKLNKRRFLLGSGTVNTLLRHQPSEPLLRNE